MDDVGGALEQPPSRRSALKAGALGAGAALGGAGSSRGQTPAAGTPVALEETGLLTDVPGLELAPWTMLFPGLTLAAAILAINLLGDELQALTDPRLRRR